MCVCHAGMPTTELPGDHEGRAVVVGLGRLPPLPGFHSGRHIWVDMSEAQRHLFVISQGTPRFVGRALSDSLWNVLECFLMSPTREILLPHKFSLTLARFSGPLLSNQRTMYVCDPIPCRSLGVSRGQTQPSGNQRPRQRRTRSSDTTCRTALSMLAVPPPSSYFSHQEESHFYHFILCIRSRVFARSWILGVGYRISYSLCRAARAAGRLRLALTIEIVTAL